jgi:hypothetical protein
MTMLTYRFIKDIFDQQFREIERSIPRCDSPTPVPRRFAGERTRGRLIGVGGSAAARGPRQLAGCD